MKRRKFQWWSTAFTVLLVLFVLAMPGEAKEPLTLDIRCFGSAYWVPSRDDNEAGSFTWEWFNMGRERRGMRPSDLGEALPLAAIAHWTTDRNRSNGEKPILFLEYYRLDAVYLEGQTLIRGYFRVIEDGFPFPGVARGRPEGVRSHDEAWVLASPALNRLMESYLKRHCISGVPVNDRNSYLTIPETYGYGPLAGPVASQGILDRAGIAIASAISRLTSIIRMGFRKQ